MHRSLRAPLLILAAISLIGPRALGQEVLWQTLFDAGKAAMAGGNYSEAQKQLQAALKNAESFEKCDSRTVSTVRALGRAYELQGKEQEAEGCYARMLECDTQSHGPNSSTVAADLCDLAAVYRHLSKFTESEARYRRAIEIYDRRKSTEQLPDLAAALINLALLYRDQGRYGEVEPMLKRAIALYEQAKQPALLAKSLDTLASYYVLQNRLSEAEPLYKRSMTLLESAGSHSLGSGNFAGLAHLYQQQGRSSDAEELFKQAIKAQESTLGKDHLDVTTTLMALAEFYRAEERCADAVPLLERALGIQQTRLGRTNATVAKTVRNLAATQLDQDNYDAAENLLKEALQIDTSSTAIDARTLAEDLNTLGLLYLRQGKYTDAEQAYSRALAVVEKAFGAQHPNSAACLNNLALLYFNQGKFDQAQPLLEKGLQIRKGSLGSDHPLVAQNMMNLAQLFESQGKYGEAEPLLKQALAIDESTLGGEHESVMVALSHLAQVYDNESKFDLAEDSYRKLLQRDEKLLGTDHPTVAGDLYSLARVLTAAGKREEAHQLKNRAVAITGRLPSNPHSLGPMTSGQPELSDLVNQPIKDKWALVVGISNFKDPSLNLKYAAKDATDFKNYLVSDANFKPDHIKLLTDKDATRDNIIANLGEKWLRRMANSDDLVVIYLSTHGSAARAEVGGANFVVPYEGNLSNIVFTGIPMQWLTTGIKDLVHCNRVVLVMDVCHGGAVAAGAKGIKRDVPLAIEKVPIGVGQVILASSQQEQLSWESRNYPNGVFTRTLIDGLRRNGSRTTLHDAYDYMKAKIEEEVLRDRAEVQTPVLVTKLWKGDDLVLPVKPVSPRPGLSEKTAANTPDAPRPSVPLVKAQSKEMDGKKTTRNVKR